MIFGFAFEQKIYEEFAGYKEGIREDTDSVSDKKEIFENILIISDEEKDELSMIFKKLVLKYHPDLVKDKATKDKYERIMKKINRAYSEGDLLALKELGKDIYTDSNLNTIEALRNKLLKIENEIHSLNQTYSELLNSKWQTLKSNLEEYKKQNRYFFNELKLKINNELTIKKSKLILLKKDYESKKNPAK